MAHPHVLLLSLPGLRRQDLLRMPSLSYLMAGGEQAALTASFPCVTWPVQANMLTGTLPDQHGVVGNGFYWRDRRQVEMWTAGNEVIAVPQIWDLLRRRDPRLRSAVWFPMLGKRCSAEWVCLPAPIHHPDGSESLWCYTQPVALYGQLRDRLGDFPLQHFWGPLAGLASSRWIAESAAYVFDRERPDFFHIYLPHLDYAAQRSGPDSGPALAAVEELDGVIGRLAESVGRRANGREVVWLAASEYVITPVDHVLFPNRILRQEGLLRIRPSEAGELLDLDASLAWALVDHQFSHVFVRDAAPRVVERVAAIFQGAAGVAEVLRGPDLLARRMGHERSGELILVSEPRSWQAYYWWLDDARAPLFARTVDIHRKPGYDPVELCFDPVARAIPLDAGLIRGSHGAPVHSDAQRGVLLCSAPGVLPGDVMDDKDVAGAVLRAFP